MSRARRPAILKAAEHPQGRRMPHPSLLQLVEVAQDLSPLNGTASREGVTRRVGAFMEQVMPV